MEELLAHNVINFTTSKPDHFAHNFLEAGAIHLPEILQKHDEVVVIQDILEPGWVVFLLIPTSITLIRCARRQWAAWQHENIVHYFVVFFKEILR